jgi:hypothetical protein
MKKTRVVLLVIALILLFGFYGAAFGGGGPEDPACLLDPFPDASQCDKTTVYADITVARAAPCAIVPSTYSVHMVVRDKKKGKPKEVHLFSFSSSLGDGDLCNLDEDDLIAEFFRLFCSLGVQDLFGFDGIAVTKYVEIVRAENCGTPAEMIQLEVAICDVPVAPPSE